MFTLKKHVKSRGNFGQKEVLEKPSGSSGVLECGIDGLIPL